MIHFAVRIVAILALVFPTFAAAQPREREAWVGAWAASPQAQPAPLQPLTNQTVRQRVTLAVAGSRLRLVISNEYGTKPLVIGAVTLGRRQGSGAPAIVPVTFGGVRSITAPIGAPVVSDPVALSVQAGSEVFVSIYLPKETLPETWHRSLPVQDADGRAISPTSEISGAGDFTGQAVMAGAKPGDRLFLSRIDVLPTRPVRTVVVLGTTRTAGDGGWPALLGQRLGAGVSIVNASMVANPLTRPYPGGGDAALARFDRDVLLVPGIRHVIIADAINDIGQVGTRRNGSYLVAPDAMPTVDELAAAYTQLATRAHARGVKVVVATILPFAGVPFADFYSPEKERLRQDFNRWLRSSRVFDGLIDMDATLRDPNDGSRYRAGMDTANHFAPSDAANRVLADSFDLKLFR